MKIWLLATEMPHLHAGGIARYVDHFARALAAAGHQCTVFTVAGATGVSEPTPGVRIVAIVPHGVPEDDAARHGDVAAHPSWPANLIGYWAALSYQFAAVVLAYATREGAPDLIESQEYGAIAYYLLQRKLTERGPLAHVPVLLQLHSPHFSIERHNQAPRYQFPAYWIGQMERFCLHAADALLSPSQFLASDTAAQVPDLPPVTVIPYPLMLPALPAAPPAAQPGDLVVVGRLELRKGILPLLAACAALWREGLDFRLTLIGSDTLSAVHALPLSEVVARRYAPFVASGQLVLAGVLPRDQLLARIQAAWAVLVPSIWDNFPNTCMEAMGIGQLVVASRAGGQAEMLGDDGSCGLVFDWDTPGDCARALRAALALDPAQRTAIGQRAQHRIADFCDPQRILAARLAHIDAIRAAHAPRTMFPQWYPGAGAAGAIPGAAGAIPIVGAKHLVPHRSEAPDALPLQDPAARAAARPAARPDPAARPAALVSIIIPFYNLGDYVEQTVASVLASTHLAIEVIIVNDGSDDASSQAALARIAAQGDARIRIVWQPNAGLVAARNAGAAVAQGAYLACVDADDTIAPTFLARAVDVLARYTNVAFVSSWVQFFGEYQGVWPTWNAELPYLLGHNQLTVLAVVRRDWYDALGGHDPQLAYSLEDYDFWLRIVAAGGIGVALPEPLVHYRMRAGSMLKQSGTAQQLYLYDLLTTRHAELYQRWGAELFNLQNANGPGHLWNHPADAPVAALRQIADLERVRAVLREDNDALVAAHAAHSAQISGQQAYIGTLEAAVAHVDAGWQQGPAAQLALLQTADAAQLRTRNAALETETARLRALVRDLSGAQDTGITRGDYLRGGRLLARARRCWPARIVARALRRGRQ